MVIDSMMAGSLGASPVVVGMFSMAEVDHTLEAIKGNLRADDHLGLTDDELKIRANEILRQLEEKAPTLAIVLGSSG